MRRNIFESSFFTLCSPNFYDMGTPQQLRAIHKWHHHLIGGEVKFCFFDALWRLLISFDVLWCILMHFDAFWCLFWCILMSFDAFRCILRHFDAFFWCLLTSFDVFWCRGREGLNWWSNLWIAPNFFSPVVIGCWASGWI